MDPPQFVVTLYDPSPALLQALQAMGVALKQDDCDSGQWSFPYDWQNAGSQHRLLSLLHDRDFVLSTQ